MRLKVLSSNPIDNLINQLIDSINDTTKSEGLVMQLAQIKTSNDQLHIKNTLESIYLTTGNIRTIGMIVTLISTHQTEADKRSYLVGLSEIARGCIANAKKEQLENMLIYLEKKSHKIKKILLNSAIQRESGNETLADFCLTAAFAKTENKESLQAEIDMLNTLFNHGADKNRRYLETDEYTTYAYFTDNLPEFENEIQSSTTHQTES